jgi:hypothetical protein
VEVLVRRRLKGGYPSYLTLPTIGIGTFKQVEIRNRKPIIYNGAHIG